MCVCVCGMFKFVCLHTKFVTITYLFDEGFFELFLYSLRVPHFKKEIWFVIVVWRLHN